MMLPYNRSTITQLDTIHYQIKPLFPVPGVGYHFLSCCPVVSHIALPNTILILLATLTT